MAARKTVAVAVAAVVVAVAKAAADPPTSCTPTVLRTTYGGGCGQPGGCTANEPGARG